MTLTCSTLVFTMTMKTTMEYGLLSASLYYFDYSMIAIAMMMALLDLIIPMTMLLTSSTEIQSMIVVIVAEQIW